LANDITRPISSATRMLHPNQLAITVTIVLIDPSWDTRMGAVQG
jgi:hypothetical protein